MKCFLLQLSTLTLLNGGEKKMRECVRAKRAQWRQPQKKWSGVLLHETCEPLIRNAKQRVMTPLHEERKNLWTNRLSSCWVNKVEQRVTRRTCRGRQGVQRKQAVHIQNNKVVCVCVCEPYSCPPFPLASGTFGTSCVCCNIKEWPMLTWNREVCRPTKRERILQWTKGTMARNRV